MAAAFDSDGASTASESWSGGSPTSRLSGGSPTSRSRARPTKILPHGFTMSQLEEHARASIRFLKKRQVTHVDRTSSATEDCSACNIRATRRSRFAELVEVFEVSDGLPASVESNSSEHDLGESGDDDELCATTSLRLLRRGVQTGEARLQRLEKLVSGMCVAFEDSLAQLVIDSDALEIRLKKDFQNSIAEMTNSAAYCGSFGKACTSSFGKACSSYSFADMQEKRVESDKLDIGPTSPYSPSVRTCTQQSEDGQLEFLHSNARALLSKAMAIARTLPSPTRQQAPAAMFSSGREEATVEAEVSTPATGVSTRCGSDSPQGPKTVSDMGQAKVQWTAPISGGGDVQHCSGD